MPKKKYLILVDLLIKTDYNAKIFEIEGKIPSIFGSATTAALNEVENKIYNVSNLVKKGIMIPKYKALNLNILAHLGITKF